MKSNEIQIKLLELEIDKLSKELMNQKCLAAEYKGKYEGIHEIYNETLASISHFFIYCVTGF